MEIIFLFSLFLLMLIENYMSINTDIKENDFPRSWHFFENHNSLESYKYGFLLNSMQNSIKHLGNNLISKKRVIFSLETNVYEINERILGFFSNPVIKLGKEYINNKIVNSIKLCRFNQLHHYRREGKIKRRLNIATLELKNGRLIRLLVVFRKIGLWINSAENEMLLSDHQIKYKIPYKNNSEYCVCVGAEDKQSFMLNSDFSEKGFLKNDVTIPVIFFHSNDQEFTSFLRSNNIDGIFGININSFNFIKRNKETVFDTLEMINKEMNPENEEIMLTYECENNELNINGQARSYFILSVYKHEKLEPNNELRTVKYDESLKIFVDYKSIIVSGAKLTIDLGLFGAEIPEFRFMQIFSLLKQKAAQHESSCIITETILGKVIDCNCEFINRETNLKIIDSNLGIYVFSLRDFVLGTDGSLEHKRKADMSIMDEKKCRVEIYGKKQVNLNYREHWTFGQVFCRAKNVKIFKKRISSVSLEIEG